jgi:hypothetical protein
MLQNVDSLKGLGNLQTLCLDNCPALQNFDGLQGLGNLQKLSLIGCSALQNVDVLKGLKGLKKLDLRGCRALSKETWSGLAAALARTTITYPDGRTEHRGS